MEFDEIEEICIMCLYCTIFKGNKKFYYIKIEILL